MDGDWMVRSSGLSKKFGLSLRRSMHYGVMDSVSRLMGHPVDTGRLRPGEFWALKDATFEVKWGESLGVMGSNGSGKTTLLRILNGIYAPDAGTVRIRGRVGALIAAGAGFAPMLTGRENIFVNGTLLGLTPQEIRSRMDEIVAFAELEEFLDMPVKHYSSGMFVRLGFAIAAVSSPDVLLVDEVLAVGDLNFQKKCYDYLFRLKRNGTSIVLVSHSIGAIWSVCDSGLFIHKGEVTYHERAEDLIRAYDEQNARNSIESSRASSKGHDSAETGPTDEKMELAGDYGHSRGGTGHAMFSAVRVASRRQVADSAEFDFGEELIIEADLEVTERISEPLLRFAIDAMHYRFVCILDNIEQGAHVDEVTPGRYQLRVSVPHQNLRPGAYKINAGIAARRTGVHIFYWFNAAQFRVRHPKELFLYAEEKAVFHLNAEYELERLGA